MKNRFFLVLIAICLLQTPVFSQSSEISVKKLGNGLTLIVQEDHSTDLIGIGVWAKAGSSNETTAKNGVSHLIEHLVFGTTAKRKPGDMDLEMESLGATLDAHTSRDWANFSTTVVSRYLTKALDVLADASINVQFPETEVGHEKLIIADEIAKKESDPMALCRDLLAKEVYGDHPYSLPVEGTRESIKNISRGDIADYYHKNYVPKNMAVVLVGDIDMQRAEAEVERAFKWSSKYEPPDISPRPITPITSQINKTIDMPFKNSYIVIGFLGPSGSEYADVCAVDVLLTYLGFGPRSWMARELRSKMGLASETQADFLTQREPGLISLIAATTPKDKAQVKEAILSRISSIRTEGIPQSDIDLATRSLLGQSAFQNETFVGRATTYGFYFAASSPDFGIKYSQCVQSVTNQDIVRVAKRYLDPERAVILTVEPGTGGTR